MQSKNNVNFTEIQCSRKITSPIFLGLQIDFEGDLSLYFEDFHFLRLSFVEMKTAGFHGF